MLSVKIADEQPSATHNDSMPRGIWGPAFQHFIVGRGLRTAKVYPPLTPGPRVNPDVHVGFEELFHKRYAMMPHSPALYD